MIQKKWGILLLIILVLQYYIIPPKIHTASLFPEEAAELFSAVSLKHNIPADILIAVAWQESKLHPYALNVSGRSYYFSNAKELIKFIDIKQPKNFDIGLMQINSWWLKRLGITYKDIINPRINLELGTLILKHCYDLYPNFFLSCYHDGKVSQRGIKYQKKILKIISFLKSEGKK